MFEKGKKVVLCAGFDVGPHLRWLAPFDTFMLCHSFYGWMDEVAR